jgi:hypothetical protein
VTTTPFKDCVDNPENPLTQLILDSRACITGQPVQMPLLVQRLAMPILIKRMRA